ncbi:MAG: fatty acid desaturase family protein [Thermoanaerobaculia bacterium]
MTTLNRQFVANGWNVKATGRIVAELAFHVSLMLAGIALMVAVDNLWVDLAAIYLMTMGSLGVATNSHSAAHFSTSNKRWVNWMLAYFGYPVVVGMSATFWRNKHVVVHHTTPNVDGLDDDIDLLPFFVLNEKDYEESRGLRRFWYKHQWLLVPFAISFNGFNLQRTGWQYLIGRLRDKEDRNALHWFDLGALLLHWTLWVFLPMLFFPVSQVLLFYVLRIVLLGYAIFIVFAPAHFPAEALFLSSGNQDRREYLKNRDWILLQCATSTNLKTSWFGNLFCSGTDYQIEHHLFPGISHPYLPKMAPLVEEWCGQHGYPYRQLGFGDGFWKSWMAFRRHKELHADAEVMRAQVAPGQRAMITQAQLAEHELL